MNRLSIRMTMAALLSLCGLVLSAGGTAAQTAKELVGTWSLVSLTVDQSGKTSEPFGPAPKGLMTFDGRRFAIIITRVGLPKFAANNREAGTPEENKAVVQGSIAFFGPYTVSEADKTLTYKIEATTFPTWEGHERKRTFTLSGDDLSLINPTPSASPGVAKTVWKGAK